MLSDDERLVKANNEFGLNLLRELSSTHPGGNVFFSPSSVSAALAMVYAGAGGLTEAELSATLGHAMMGLTDRTALMSAYRKLLADNQYQAVALDIANAVLIRRNFRVLDGYKRDLADVFKANLTSVDFAHQGSKVASEIDQWVKQKTKGKIQNIVEGGLPEDTAMFLISAVYFKSTWVTKFDSAKTKPRPFYNHGTESSDRQTMELMSQVKFGRLDSLRSRAVEIPYKGDRVSMVVLLPDSNTGLPRIRDGLTAEVLKELEDRMWWTTLRLPKFEQVKEYNFVPILQKLGLKSVFTANADLSRAADPGLFVSDVKHKAMIEVSEEGTEAAAVTTVRNVNGGRGRSIAVPQTRRFHVEHPFLFYIRDKVTNRVLFMGEINRL
ncbi:intracellular coagulation inhibitor 3-like [Ixodes scapularis]|uniref:intracellular coagulation inhibitor 3-like n=1 Tax=Ixodes scapularis TaxID=6945 RepID=UPI001C37F91D|nr:intracellular coagulation inhibitor 3-like [Ixodes scapularis]